MNLEKALKRYAEKGIYPFHMPGHKRNLSFPDPYRIDITEIEGFDNLHNAQGILRQAQEEASHLYQSKKTYYLVNGSTCGILAAMMSCTVRGSRILMARNCHKSVYHAVLLNQLRPVYLSPGEIQIGLQGQIKVSDVKDALERYPDIRVMILTSPTYDGVLSDVRAIAEVAHRHDVLLIVDQAHGAHLGLDPSMESNAIQDGADIVVMSVHKTLPSFTQTALLHLVTDRPDKVKVEQYLDIFETSSPSYLLMAGIDYCLRFVGENRERLFEKLSHNLKIFHQKTETLKMLHVVRKEEISEIEAFGFDETKILVRIDGDVQASEIADELRERYSIEIEMTSKSYILAIATVMDTEEGFDRFAKALIEIDKNLLKKKIQQSNDVENIHNSIETDIKKTSLNEEWNDLKTERVLEIDEAKSRVSVLCDWQNVEGKICADFLIPYPPGIPLIVPGERIDRNVIDVIHSCLESGRQIEGFLENYRINIVQM